jgi:hypothetical protein
MTGFGPIHLPFCECIRDYIGDKMSPILVDLPQDAVNWWSIKFTHFLAVLEVAQKLINFALGYLKFLQPVQAFY